MILLLSTCSQKLSEEEFVRPIEKILLKNKLDFMVKHCSEDYDPSKYDKIIICGTALKDFEYLKDVEKFGWIKKYGGKLMGICSGMQMISIVYGMKLKGKVMIGSREVKIVKKEFLDRDFKAYFLVSKQPVLNKEFIALAEDESVIKHKSKDVYGFLFHPEVLNPELIVKFCEL